MINDFLIPFIAVGLAELGDKTQLSIILISSKTKNHAQLLAGAFIAFLIVDGIAVALGSWITQLIPGEALKLISGVVFLVFGVLMFKSADAGRERSIKLESPLYSAFLLVFAAEWGDKTQIASALFAARYNPALVLAGVMASLTLLSAAAIYLGKLISERVHAETVAKISGAVFILLGLSFMFI